MAESLSPLAIIWKELHDARLLLLDVRWIRVTTAAFAGSPTTVMLSPERVRLHALRAYPDGVDADLALTDRWRELVIHPKDWLVLRKDDLDVHALTLGADVDRLWGVPVTVDPLVSRQ